MVRSTGLGVLMLPPEWSAPSVGDARALDPPAFVPVDDEGVPYIVGPMNGLVVAL